MGHSAQIFLAELEGRDRIELHLKDGLGQLQAIGCLDLLRLIQQYRAHQNRPVQEWPLPSGSSHGEILLREVILKAQNKWAFPYPHEELCHCRLVPAHKVDQAIIAGAHTTDIVSRQTSASTACGTCRPDSQKIIDFRLGRSGS